MSMIASALVLSWLALSLVASATHPEDAAAAPLARAAGFRVAAVDVHAMTLRWRDRSRGESRYELARRAAGERRWERSRRSRGSERFKSRRLAAGTVYEHRVRACHRKRCSRWSPVRRQATLLAPFNGPHPSPRCEVLPGGDYLRRDVSADPIHPRSARIVARINARGGDSLHPDFGSLRYGIPYVVVPAAQPAVPIRFGAFGGESDPGPYPIPPRAPVEVGSDRHVLVVRRPASPGGACSLHELYRADYRGGRRNAWSADSGAYFDLGSKLPQRPDGWTSADAAGLPIFPGLVTYEEARSGEIDHAIRVTFERTRREYIHPATHWASASCHPDDPPMGLRLRLRADYDISRITGAARVIAEALKRYGMIVADNGSNWFITGSSDSRWDRSDLEQLKRIPGDAFEALAPAARPVSPC